MKKIVFALCVAAIMLFMSFSAFASEDYYLLQDIAELLTEGENAEVFAKLESLSEKHGMDVAIITVDATEEGLSVAEDAMEWYEFLGYDTDGIMLYISMAENDWYILTSGFGITAITDAGIDYISDKFVYMLSGGDYVGAFNTFIQYIDEFVVQAQTGEPYDVGNMPKEEYNLIMNLIISLIIGFIVAKIITGKWKKTLVSVEKQKTATDYVREGSFNLVESRDFFLYRTVDREEKEEKSKGGSTARTSSSGNTFGGGGGKF